MYTPVLVVFYFLFNPLHQGFLKVGPFERIWS